MSDIVERLGVLAASLANPQAVVDAQREIERLQAVVVSAEQNALMNSQKLVGAHAEIERLRALVSSLESSPMSEEALDILRSENAKLRAELQSLKDAAKARDRLVAALIDNEPVQKEPVEE